MKKPIGKNSLGSTIRVLVKAARIDKKGRMIINKTMCRIGISQMEEVGVPVEKRLRITSHWDAKSYAKYLANNNEANDKVCQDLVCGTTTLASGKTVQFEDMLLRENEMSLFQNVYSVAQLHLVYEVLNICFVKLVLFVY
jgi:hypothetical protein